MDTRSKHSALRRYGLLALATLLIAAVVGAIAIVARDSIDANERSWFIAHLDALVPPAMHDNDLYADRIEVSDPDLLGSPTPVPIYRARKNGVPVAAIL